MNERINLASITPDENGKIDVSALRDYIDSVVAEKVRLAIAEINVAGINATAGVSLAASVPPPDFIAPCLATPELEKLWIRIGDVTWDDGLPVEHASMSVVNEVEIPDSATEELIAQVFYGAPEIGIGLAESVSPYATPFPTYDAPFPVYDEPEEYIEEQRKMPRFSLRKRLSFLVVGVVVVAIAVQLLGSYGILDFHGYAELTSALFGNVFAG